MNEFQNNETKKPKKSAKKQPEQCIFLVFDAKIHHSKGERTKESVSFSRIWIMQQFINLTLLMNQ